MMNRMIARLSVVSALAAVLTVTPALAQGKGNGNKKEEKAKQTEVRKPAKQAQKRPELQRRDRAEQQPVRRTEARRGTETRRTNTRPTETRRTRDDDRYDDRYDDRSGTRASGNGAGKVPPGWCQGKGNPHATRENCGNRTDGRYDDRSDDRYGRDTYSRSGRYGSYEEAHLDYHRYLDQKYSDLADDRPLDPMYQIRIRRDRKAEHDRWHAEQGRSHEDY